MTDIAISKTLRVRVIAREDAAAVAELCVQLGYEASQVEIEERITALLSNAENQILKLRYLRMTLILVFPLGCCRDRLLFFAT